MSSTPSMHPSKTPPRNTCSCTFKVQTDSQSSVLVLVGTHLTRYAEIKFYDQTSRSFDCEPRFLWGLVTSHRKFQKFWVDVFDLVVEVLICSTDLMKILFEDFVIGIHGLSMGSCSRMVALDLKSKDQAVR